jgi:hypothetical protein
MGRMHGVITDSTDDEPNEEDDRERRRKVRQDVQSKENSGPLARSGSCCCRSLVSVESCNFCQTYA